MSRPFSKKSDLSRTNSICPTPEILLLEYVKKNDAERIRKLINAETSSLLSHIYEYPYDKPILYIALTENNTTEETIQVLIDSGADLYYPSPLDEDWEAIHFGAVSARSKILSVIINNLKPGKINELAKGKNALHLLIIDGNRENEEEFIRCAELLIQSGINVNEGDANNISPILWAAKKGLRSIIKTILETSIETVDLDTHMSRGKTARDWIIEKQLCDELPDKSAIKTRTSKEVLFALLKQSNETGFVNFNDGKLDDLADTDDTSSTLLQYACEKGLKKCVSHLLQNNADPNKATNKNRDTPIELAAKAGNYEIFELLINNSQTKIPNEIITHLIKNTDQQNYLKCYDLLMEKLSETIKYNSAYDINAVDNVSNTPLHYAIRYAEPEKVHQLLGLGASLATKNQFGVMPVEDIDPAVLEKHLDNCITIESKHFDREDFTVAFNYGTLIPPRKRRDDKNLEISCTESAPIDEELAVETEVIYYMSKAVEFKHLLKHPVIVAFLFMKWHRIRWLFYTNLIFYIAYFLSLIIYVFTSYGNFNDTEKSAFTILIIDLSLLLLWLTYVLLVLREIFQIIVSPNKYFKNFENYIEIILIIITGIILMFKSSADIRKQLSAISILLAAFELVLMMGQHPLLSTNVVMLRTVSYNFFKFLSWYSLLIIAFALSFYILFTPATAESNQTDGKEDDQFDDPGKSIFKTIVMLTGEFDASDLNFQTYPIISKLIFTLFVFMIAIILLNLLNGLAVSDTQMIKNDAELVGHIARAEHIRYVESMLLGNILPSSVLKWIQNICCCVPVSVNCPTSNTFIKPLARRACIFPQVLEFSEYEMIIYPNKHGQILVNHCGNRRGKNSSNCSFWLYTINLDKDTIKRINSIVQAKREEISNSDKLMFPTINDRFQQLKSSIEVIQKDQTLINNKLEIILNYIYENSV